MPPFRKLFIIGILSLISLHVVAQKDTLNPAYMAVKPQYGFILPHSKTIQHLSHTNPYGIEAEYGWYLTGTEDWKRCNCYSRAGFSFMYIDYANPDVLGQSLNLIAYAEPLLAYRGNWKASVRMGVGFSYLTKVYDAETNPENLFFSFPLSYLVHLDVNLTRNITEKAYFFLYGKYNHISNGGVKEPNKGMNFPTMGIGLGYNLDPLKFPEKEKVPLKKPVPVIPEISTFMSGRSIHVEGASEYKLALGINLKAWRKVSRLNALSIGMEGVYDRSLFNRQEARDNFILNSYYSVLAGHAFVFGRFIFSQEWGTYLYAPYYYQDFFQRYTLTYRVFDKLRMGVTLKAHAEVAENFNIIISYDLK
jgi:hypothetical protein